MQGDNIAKQQAASDNRFTVEGVGIFYPDRGQFGESVYTFTVCSQGNAECGSVVGFALGARDDVSVQSGSSVQLDRCRYGLSNSLAWNGGSGGGDCKSFDTVLSGRVPFRRLCRVVNVGNGDTAVYSSPSGSCTYVVEGTLCSGSGSLGP